MPAISPLNIVRAYIVTFGRIIMDTWILSTTGKCSILNIKLENYSYDPYLEIRQPDNKELNYLARIFHQTSFYMYFASKLHFVEKGGLYY